VGYLSPRRPPLHGFHCQVPDSVPTPWCLLDSLGRSQTPTGSCSTCPGELLWDGTVSVPGIVTDRRTCLTIVAPRSFSNQRLVWYRDVTVLVWDRVPWGCCTTQPWNSLWHPTAREGSSWIDVEEHISLKKECAGYLGLLQVSPFFPSFSYNRQQLFMYQHFNVSLI
jgi:hypothetical protein